MPPYLAIVPPTVRHAVATPAEREIVYRMDPPKMSSYYCTFAQFKANTTDESARAVSLSFSSQAPSFSHKAPHIEKRARFDTFTVSPKQSCCLSVEEAVVKSQSDKIERGIVSNVFRQSGQILFEDSSPRHQAKSSMTLWENVNKSSTPSSSLGPLKKKKVLGARGFANMDLRGEEEELRPTPRRPIRQASSSPEVSTFRLF